LEANGWVYANMMLIRSMMSYFLLLRESF